MQQLSLGCERLLPHTFDFAHTAYYKIRIISSAGGFSHYLVVLNIDVNYLIVVVIVV